MSESSIRFMNHQKTMTTAVGGGAAGGGGGEDRVMATAQQIVNSLPKDVSEDMLMILSSFDNRLSNITSLISGGKGVGLKVDERFVDAEKVILRADSSSEGSRHWEDSPDDAAEYLTAIDEIIQFTEDLSVQENGEVMDRAENALQLAMSRLEEEFRHILIRNTVPLDADRMYGSIRRVSLSFAVHDEEIGEFGSSGEDDGESSCFHERGASLGDDPWVDLIFPDAVVELKEIADRMIRSGYEKECCQVYSSVRRDVLDECLSILGVEKLSIEEVHKIEWKSLDEKMKKWIQAVKVVVRVLLTGEKKLCEQLFGGSELIKEVCFTETAKGCVVQLMNFGEAVAIGRRSSEKLFRILDMYDAWADVLQDLEALFSDESCGFVCDEARGVFDGLGEAAKGTLAEFENAIRGETSGRPTQSGEIHPMTRYVMNYVKLLVDYSESLNLLFERSGAESDRFESDRLQNDDGDNEHCGDMSPIGRRLVLLISYLEANLEEKAKYYEDNAMKYIFLMNNILYVVQKVKDSELGKFLGDNWVRKRRGLIRQYSTSYLRATWTKVLLCLKDEGIGGSSNNASKVALKERFKNFNLCFEDIYRIQTGWKVPDEQLREELRISISEKVLPAYRSFMGRFGNQIDGGRNAGKYIKYTPEDLEDYLLHLFEGSPCVLHHVRRKSG